MCLGKYAKKWVRAIKPHLGGFVLFRGPHDCDDTLIDLNASSAACHKQEVITDMVKKCSKTPNDFIMNTSCLHLKMTTVDKSKQKNQIFWHAFCLASSQECPLPFPMTRPAISTYDQHIFIVSHTLSAIDNILEGHGMYTGEQLTWHVYPWSEPGKPDDGSLKTTFIPSIVHWINNTLHVQTQMLESVSIKNIFIC